MGINNMNERLSNYLMAVGSFPIVENLNKIETIVDSTKSQLNNLLNDFNSRRVVNARLLKQRMSVNPYDDSLRSRAVDLAWDYERAEVMFGTNGSRDWSAEQLKELIETGKISGAEGHHIFDVSSNLGKQVNPDNIMFAKTAEEHLNVFHRGDYDNPTTGEYINRNQRLSNAANQNIVVNELSALLNSAGMGFLLGSVTEAVYQIINNKDKTIDSKKVLSNGLFGSTIASGTHLTFRIIGGEISTLIGSFITAFGFNSINAALSARYLTTSSISVLIYNSLIYFKNRKSMSKEEALIQFKKDIKKTSKFSLVSSGLVLLTGSLGFSLFVSIVSFIAFEYFKEREENKTVAQLI
jgi:hypothetical protein